MPSQQGTCDLKTIAGRLLVGAPRTEHHTLNLSPGLSSAYQGLRRVLPDYRCQRRQEHQPTAGRDDNKVPKVPGAHPTTQTVQTPISQ